MDLIKTIEDDDDVKYLSDESESDQDLQPQKKKCKMKETSADFDQNFQFGGGQEDYGKDTWTDICLERYLKKKKGNKTSTDDKIAKVRKAIQDDHANEDDDDDELSGEDLVHDDIKVNEGEARKKAKKKAKLKEDKLKVLVENNGESDSESEEEQEFFEMPNPSFASEDSFHAMGLSRPILKAIESMKFTHPTPIQAATIPIALAGKDICGCAATGTGKTAAYMLPVLERLLYRPKDVAVTRVLVLVPTRELGVQVFTVTRQLSRFSSDQLDKQITIALSVGGLEVKDQAVDLRKRPDIVIATPGRLIDHVYNTPSFTLDNIEVLILDEADRLLEEAFMEQMKEIIKSCSPKRQTLLFSATMTDQVHALASVSLKKPVKIFVDSNKVVASNLRQEFVRIRPNMAQHRDAFLACLICRTFRDHAMVFIRTKRDCHRLHILLGLLGVKVGELHGNMSQALRLQALKQFKDEEIDVLLTTDVAARGLDIVGVKTVINYQLPETLEKYIHRVGRTARAGRIGRSISFADEDHRKMVKEIVSHARDPVKHRVIPKNVIERYIKKIENLKDEVKKVLEEEQAEREIASLENKANRMENELKNENPNGSSSEPPRTWFKSNSKKENNKKERKKMNKRIFDNEEDIKEYKQAEFIFREAKRSRKPKKIRTVYDGEQMGSANVSQRQKKRKGSVFEDDITNVKRKNVKKLRYAANQKKQAKNRRK